jgi:hypothetical protein
MQMGIPRPDRDRDFDYRIQSFHGLPGVVVARLKAQPVLSWRHLSSGQKIRAASVLIGRVHREALPAKLQMDHNPRSRQSE